MHKRIIVLIVVFAGLLAFSPIPAHAAQVGPVDPNAVPAPAPEPDEDAPVVKKEVPKPASLVNYDEAVARFGQCANLEDYVLRLQCFNRISVDMGYPENPVTREELAKYGFWRATARTNTAGEKTYNMRLNPNTPFFSTSGVQRMPELILSCRVGSTEAYIDWKAALTPLNQNHKSLDVVYTYDTLAPVYTKWDISADKFALFIPRGVEFIQNMHDRKVLNVQFTPINEQLVTLSFSLNGLENILNIMYEKCYK